MKFKKKDMRQIKFKVWDIGKKAFIPQDVYVLTFNTDSKDFGVMIKDWENYKEGEYFYPNSQIALEYTGLMDILTKQGYEGDIIERDASDGKGKVRGVIVFEEGQFRVNWLDKNKGWNNSLYIHLEESKIIGNVYQSPELLTSPL